MKDFLSYQGLLSKLSKQDLKQLFRALENYKFKYRKTLELDERVSFGTEIEFEDVLLYYVKKEFSKHPSFHDWIVKEDKSVRYIIDGFDVGGEVSSPILHDLESDWKNLSNVIQTLQMLHAHAKDKTSLHVHVGSQIFGEDLENVIRFVKIWCIFEHVIFKFAYGRLREARSQILYFAHPIAEVTKLKEKKIPHYFETIGRPKSLSLDKKWALNFQNYYSLSSMEELGNTIEIRCANGSLDRNIIQNTIHFYLKLMMYVTSEEYDDVLINRLFDRLHVKDFAEYADIYIKDALKLVDLIFDSSLDKINFLKQYIKKDEYMLIK